MPVHRSGSRRRSATAYALLAGQIALLVLLVVWSPERRWVLPVWLDGAAALVGVVGLAWVALGLLALGRSASAVPLPVAHGHLKTGGLYRLSRHPIYTGLLLFAWADALRSASPWPPVIAATLHILLLVKARFEERALADAYPGYVAYAARTPRFVPLGRR
jgi:protein-S-isoprenylcysteine O-methyltransferase Ste14